MQESLNFPICNSVTLCNFRFGFKQVSYFVFVFIFLISFVFVFGSIFVFVSVNEINFYPFLHNSLTKITFVVNPEPEH